MSKIFDSILDVASSFYFAVSKLIIFLLTNKYTLSLFGLLLIVYAIKEIKKWYRHRKSWFITTKILEERKKSCRTEKLSFFKQWIEQIYIPSWSSFLIIILGLIPFVLLSHSKWALSLQILNFSESNHYQNLIAVHAGIGAIIFALLIFVAESLRDDETKDRARVLLKESFLFPLTVAEILVFFNFLWGDVNIWSVVPIVGVGLFTLWSLSRLILVLLSKYRFQQKRLQLLKDRVKRSIDLAIDERFGNNALLGLLGEGKIELSYMPSIIGEESDYVVFSSKKFGVVTDIRIDKLEQIGREIEAEANKNGFSFYSEKARPATPDIANQETPTSVSTTRYKHDDHRYLLKRYKSEITEDDKRLLGVHKNVVTDPKVIERLQHLTEEAFVIGHSDNFSEEIKAELIGLNDQFISAILEKKIGEVEAFSRAYIQLAEAFLEMLNACGGGYTPEQAKKERSAFFGGWSEIQWLQNSVRELLQKASESDDKDIIADVGFLPKAIAIRAIKNGDHYLFQEFISFSPHLYWLSLEKSNGAVKDFMIDRSWRYLKEVAEIYVESKLKKKDVNEDELEQYKGFAIFILLVFQRLVKAAFDHGDSESFSKFVYEFSRLYRHFDPEEEHPTVEHLRLNLQHVADASQKEKLLLEIKAKEKREAIGAEIKLKKAQSLFGIAAWAFYKYRNNQTDQALKGFYDTIKAHLPSSLDALTNVYTSSRDFESEDFWGWDSWAMEGLPEGEAHFIDVHSKLDHLYCVKALQILESKNDPAIQEIVLPHSRSIAFLAEENSELGKILTDIESNKESWSFELSENAIKKVGALKNLLKSAKRAQENADIEYLKQVELSDNKIREFISDFIKSFYEAATLRAVVALKGNMSDLSKTDKLNERIEFWGFNQIDDKAVFIENWHVHYPSWGAEYGRSLGTSENERVFSQFVDSLTEAKTNGAEFLTTIKDILSETKLKDPALIGVIGWQLEYETLRNSGVYVDKWRQDTDRLGYENMEAYTGYIKIDQQKIPVFRTHLRKQQLRNYLILTSLKDVGEWVQYPPLQKIEDRVDQKDIFRIRISDLNKENIIRNDLISKNPDWLQTHEDKEGYLRQKVLINAVEKFEFKIKDKNAGRKISIQNYNEGSEEE